MRQSLFAGAILFSLASCSQTSASAGKSGMISLDVGERPRALISGDFDAIGRPDLAVANADSNSVSVLLQDEAGHFARTDYAAGTEPADISAADINNDDFLDLIVANHETSSVSVLINSGDGTFTIMDGSPFDTGARPHLHSVAVADFNGDGFSDIAADSSDTDSVAVLFGNFDGFEAARQVDAGEFPYYRLGTLQSDTGVTVLVPSPRAHQVSKIVFSDDAPSKRIPIGEAVGAVMARSANLDDNGGMDVVALMSGSLAMWTHSSQGFKAVTETPAVFEGPTEISVGDIDGDGKDEVAVSLWESDQISVVSNTGAVIASFSACYRPASLTITDLNDDGFAEIVAGCWNGSKILIFDGADVASRF